MENLKLLIDSFLSALNNGVLNYAIAISTIITSLFSILINFRYKKSKDYYRFSLEKVYLPLKKLFFTCNKKSTSKQISDVLLTNETVINTILIEYYEYFSPNLPELFQTLIINTKNMDFDKKQFDKIMNILDKEYVYLKHNLGYPYMSFFDIFMKKSATQKMVTIFSIISHIFILTLCFLYTFIIIFLFMYGTAGQIITITSITMLILLVFFKVTENN